jgi:hypothetical protein
MGLTGTGDSRAECRLAGCAVCRCRPGMGPLRTRRAEDAYTSRWVSKTACGKRRGPRSPASPTFIWRPRRTCGALDGVEFVPIRKMLIPIPAASVQEPAGGPRGRSLVAEKTGDASRRRWRRASGGAVMPIAESRGVWQRQMARSTIPHMGLYLGSRNTHGTVGGLTQGMELSGNLR